MHIAILSSCLLSNSANESCFSALFTQTWFLLHLTVFIGDPKKNQVADKKYKLHIGPSSAALARSPSSLTSHRWRSDQWAVYLEELEVIEWTLPVGPHHHFVRLETDKR